MNYNFYYKGKNCCKVAFFLDAETHCKLKVFCVKNNLTMNDVIAGLIQDFLNLKNGKGVD